MSTVYEDPAERERAIAAIKAEPPRPGESLFGFLDRIAKKAGLMKPEQRPLLERMREPGEEG